MFLFTPNLRAVHNTHAPFEFQEDECLLQKTTAIDNRLLNFMERLFCAPHNYQHKGIVCNLCGAVFLCVPVIQTLRSYISLFNLSCAGYLNSILS